MSSLSVREWTVETITAPGTFEDERGIEAIMWTIGPSDRAGWRGRFEVRSRIRGVEVWGFDFDVLEPDDANDAGVVALPLNSGGELANCVLAGELPCVIENEGVRQPFVVHFRLDLRPNPDRTSHDQKNLMMSAGIAGDDVVVTDDWFEDATLRLDRALRPRRMICCATCLYSDYSPAGHGLLGMRCHRDAKERYLAVRSKRDYFDVAVTEDVPETYLCDEYAVRIPGTGYRG